MKASKLSMEKAVPIKTMTIDQGMMYKTGGFDSKIFQHKKYSVMEIASKNSNKLPHFKTILG